MSCCDRQMLNCWTILSLKTSTILGLFRLKQTTVKLCRGISKHLTLVSTLTTLSLQESRSPAGSSLCLSFSWSVPKCISSITSIPLFFSISSSFSIYVRVLAPPPPPRVHLHYHFTACPAHHWPLWSLCSQWSNEWSLVDKRYTGHGQFQLSLANMHWHPWDAHLLTLPVSTSPAE